MGVTRLIAFTFGLDCRAWCKVGSKTFEFEVPIVVVLVGDVSPGLKGELCESVNEYTEFRACE